MGRYSSIFSIPLVLPAGGGLAIISRPRGYDWLDDDIRALKADGITHIASLLEPHEMIDLGLTDEALTARRFGLKFTSVPIIDRSVPSNQVSFLRSAYDLSESVAAGDVLGIHCRQSVGRSSLLAVVILKFLGKTLGDALASVQTARGLPIPDTDEQLAWLRGLSMPDGGR